MKPKLMKHQEVGVDFLASHDVAALLMDRGTGKTPTVLTELSDRVGRGEVKRALYVAPLSTLENVRREAVRFTDHLKPQVVFGSRAVREKMVRSPNGRNLDIVNYDALRILSKSFMEAKYDAIIADESTRIKDRATQVTRVSHILGTPIRVKRILTGMPFTEGVEDAWSQFYFLHPSIVGSNYYSFRNRYCVTAEFRNPKTGKKFHKITGYRNLKEFEDRIARVTYRVAKEDCLDLPPKTFETLRVRMLEAQAKQYSTVERQTFSEIGDHEISHQMALTKLAKLRQIAAGFIYDDEHEPVHIPSSKYEELEDVLKESLYDAKKAVIFTSFRAEPQMVVERIESMKKRIKSFVLPAEPHLRQPEIDKWSAWKESPAVLISNARSGGIGLNMTAAHMAIFLSNDWRMEDRAQAEDRIHRIGSEVHNKVTIVDIVTEGTIEEDVLEALKSKRDLVEVFLERLRRRGNGGGR